jgi:hypothetical protein
MLRHVFYALVLVGLLSGGLLDARAGHWKSAVIAGLFALANGVIFYWRE